MTKYTAFRIDRGAFNPEAYKIDYDKFQVLGQRETDLNWSVLFTADSFEECEAFARREWEKTTGFFPVYGLGGYGLPWSSEVR